MGNRSVHGRTAGAQSSGNSISHSEKYMGEDVHDKKYRLFLLTVLEKSDNNSHIIKLYLL